MRFMRSEKFKATVKKFEHQKSENGEWEDRNAGAEKSR